MKIQTIDPYEDLYDPSGVIHKVYPRKMVEAVDYLLKISGPRNDVVTANDWMVVGKIIEFWCRTFPGEWNSFQGTIKDIRGTRARKDGYSKDKGRAGTRYLAAIPPRLMKMIKIIFPQQQWDREFTDKFVKNFKFSQVGEKIDTWFVIPEAPVKRKSIDEMVSDSVKSTDGDTN